MISRPNGQPPIADGLLRQAATKRRTSDELPPFIGDYIPVLSSTAYQDYASGVKKSRSSHWDQLGQQLRQWGTHFLKQVMTWKLRDLFGIPLVLIVLWAVVLWWGEETVFRRKVEDCAWDHWENWVCYVHHCEAEGYCHLSTLADLDHQPTGSAPHHLVLIADPQLVDPHTYPGRPWPLSWLTVRYTDLYMRKSFQQIQNILSPDSVFFLGDLFDGGREWSTTSGNSEERESPDKRWRKYDTRYWMKEYTRFSRIFFDPWLRGERPGRKIVAALPGNHDLGLGNGIRIPVRQRFQAYFGNGNRLDIVGNHSFVSLDTVSLSAKGQPNQGASEQGANVEIHSKDVWEPVEQFLHTAKTEKARAIDRDLRIRNGKPENDALEQLTLELDDPRAHTITLGGKMTTDLPSVVLTHVPLYRAEGTPCGPLRERFPSSKAPNGESLEKDDGNSIHVRAGVQYQNVLTPAISNEIVDLVGDVTHVFSGDDHDYCDIIHRGFTSNTGGIREITVKSFSWAMGVRKPGVVLLSLWNPVDAQGKAVSQGLAKPATIQTHLCLLPDQLSIFIRYGWLLAMTVTVLLVRAARMVSSRQSPKHASGQLLPLSKMDYPRTENDNRTAASARSPCSKHRLSVRSSAGRPRSLSPSNGYGYQPPAEEVELSDTNDRANGSGGNSLVDKGWNDIALDEPSKRRPPKGSLAVYHEFRSSVVQVASLVLVFYGWLLINS